MIKAKRVLEVVDFLKPDETWSAMATEGMRITVFGQIDKIFKVEMSKPIPGIGMTRKFDLVELDSISFANAEEVLAFGLVEMAGRLGAYED